MHQRDVLERSRVNDVSVGLRERHYALDYNENKPNGEAMRRTPGRWVLRGNQVRAGEGYGKHVATYQVSRADGLLLAAAPQLLEMVLAAISSGEACGGARALAWVFKEQLVNLGLIRISFDVDGESEVSDANPEVP